MRLESVGCAGDNNEMMKITSVFAVLTFAVGCLPLRAPAAVGDSRYKARRTKSFVELGRVQWHRDEQAAVARAKGKGLSREGDEEAVGGAFKSRRGVLMAGDA